MRYIQYTQPRPCIAITTLLPTRMSYNSPSAIFSPSVARQQRAVAKDWNYIDGWLSRKFNGKTAPPFERNADTLKVLLALAAANEAADEDRDLLSKVEAKALADLKAQQEIEPHAITFQFLEDNLTREARSSLNALAAASVVLNEPLAITETMARKVLNLQVTSFDLEQASDRMELLRRHLEQEITKVDKLVEDLRSDKFRPPAELSKQTQEYQRKIKLLTAKLPELKDRAISLDASAPIPKPTISDICHEEDRYTEVMGIVKDLESKVKSFHGLPHDVDLARLELEALRVELNDLSRQRDAMFEGLVERESPKKAQSRR